MRFKNIIWLLITGMLLVSANAFADDVNLLISRANRFFSPLPESMPGAESDTPQRIALGKNFILKNACLSMTSSPALPVIF